MSNHPRSDFVQCQVWPFIIGNLGIKEVEATVACFLTDMRFPTALWAILLVPNLRQPTGYGLLLCFCFILRLELLCTRCIGLNHCALRMDSISRIGHFATDWTNSIARGLDNGCGVFVVVHIKPCCREMLQTYSTPKENASPARHFCIGRTMPDVDTPDVDTTVAGCGIYVQLKIER